MGALLLFALAAGAGAAVVSQAHYLRARDEREAASQAAAGAAFSLEQEVARSMSATYALAAIVHQHGRIDDFDALAAHMLPLYGRVAALQLAPGGVIRETYPRAGNEAAIGHDLLRDPDRRFQALEAIRRRRLVVAGPFELKQGGVGLVGRLPVFVPDSQTRTGQRFWGFVTALVKLTDVVQASRLGQLADAGYHWELSRQDEESGRRVGFATSGGAALRDPVAWPVIVPNGEWRLEVAPASGWHSESGVVAQYALALAVATFLAGLAFAVLRQPHVLRSQVEARTRELAEANTRLAADVVERERAEIALSAETQRLAVTLRSIGDAVIATDIAGRITLFNPVAEGITGWTGEQALGRDVHEVLKIVDQETLAPVSHLVDDVAGEAIAAGARHTVLTARDGTERPIAQKGAPIRDAGGRVTGVVLVLRDQSEERRVEEKLRQSQRLETVGRLAGGVAHDFNNLLTVILACADAAKDDVDGRRPVDAAVIEDIHAAGERAAVLTRQLLAFARKQVVAPVALNLNTVLQGSEKLLRRVLGEDVEIVTTLEGDLATIRCDPGQIEQVILNLALNARDAMPVGGRLFIETANALVSREQADAAPGMRPGRYVRLTVRDSGTGMADDVKTRIFEPFFTTKPVGKGTGLGLATVQGIVQQSEGHIAVTSAVGQGTTFDVYFPAAEATPIATAADAELLTARGSETILLVEDDAQVREVVARSLRAVGYRVLVAGSGTEALEVAARIDAPLDLLVTDVIMPAMNGRFVADVLRATYPGLRVLFISGFARDALAQRGALEPEIELLPKPFTASVLLRRVRAILDARAGALVDIEARRRASTSARAVPSDELATGSRPCVASRT